MKIFRTKDKSQQEFHPFIAKGLLYCRNQLKNLAAWLARKASHYSSRQLKILLIGFCFLFGSGSILIIYDSGKARHAGLYFIVPIHPMPLLKEESHQAVITGTEYSRVHAFKNFVDSLAKSTRGKAKAEELLKNRTHLLDSINLIEKLYYEQQTNK